MKYYPIFLNLDRKRVLVIGGGEVALRKVNSLIKCAPSLTVVSKEIHPRIESLSLKHQFSLFKREFRERDLIDKDLVFCATNDSRVNERVACAAMDRGIWVNVVDHPSLCSFIVPSTVNRGEVTFAISTGGASPALSQFLRKKIERNFGEEIGVLSARLKKERSSLLKLPIEKRRKVLKGIFKELKKK